MRRFNPGNFYCGTTAEWTSCPRPVRHPDRMSGSGSDYWYGESGVVRYSDHWGSEVASCDWYLDGVARCSFDDHYGTAQGRGAGHALVLTRLQPARRPARLDQGRGVREAACRRRARGRRAARGGGRRRRLHLHARRNGIEERRKADHVRTLGSISTNTARLFLSTWPRVRKAALYIAKNVFSLFNK